MNFNNNAFKSTLKILNSERLTVRLGLTVKDKLNYLWNDCLDNVPVKSKLKQTPRA